MILDVRFNENSKVINTSFNEQKLTISPSFTEVVVVTSDVPSGDYPFYYGDYVVTPDLESQTLETAMTILKKDVTVKAIPHYTVGNTSGGDTVFIAMEV